MRATSLFSLRRALLPKTLPGILFFLLLGVWGFLWFHDVFNPPDQNHLLIIDRSGHESASECVAVLEGEVDWQVPVPFIRRGNQLESAVTIINIERAWFSGMFRINDSTGRVLASAEIRPTGRYCGTLVMVLLPDGASQTAFNRLPDSRKE